MDKDKISILCEYLDNTVAERYPVSNKDLAESTDYIKNGYLKMLAVVMQQSGMITEPQLKMFKRIIAGADTDKQAEDFLRMALDIEIDDYIQFSNECKDLQLKYRWMLDAMIVTCVQERTDEQLILIAQFAESYEITKEELEYIATMAKAIIAMDESAYVSAYEVKADSISDAIFSDYMYLISKKCVCSNDNMTIFQPTHDQNITAQMLEKIEELNTPCVKIIGANIRADDCEITFENREKVILEGCTFVGGDKNPIYFISCKEIVINNCRFDGFSTITIKFDTAEKVLVTNCKFRNCILEYSYDHYYGNILGGVFYSDDPGSIGKFNLIGTEFIECGAFNKCPYSFSEFISNINSLVDRCSFINCWHMSRDRGHINSGETMFTRNSSATNCTYDNSARFN